MSTLGLFLLLFREHQKQEDPGVGRGELIRLAQERARAKTAYISSC